MAAAWGKSWGASWGDSWGLVAVVPPVTQAGYAARKHNAKDRFDDPEIDDQTLAMLMLAVDELMFD